MSLYIGSDPVIISFEFGLGFYREIQIILLRYIIKHFALKSFNCMIKIVDLVIITVILKYLAKKCKHCFSNQDQILTCSLPGSDKDQDLNLDPKRLEK